MKEGLFSPFTTRSGDGSLYEIEPPTVLLFSRNDVVIGGYIMRQRGSLISDFPKTTLWVVKIRLFLRVRKISRRSAPAQKYEEKLACEPDTPNSQTF